MRGATDSNPRDTATYAALIGTPNKLTLTVGFGQAPLAAGYCNDGCRTSSEAVEHLLVEHIANFSCQRVIAEGFG